MKKIILLLSFSFLFLGTTSANIGQDIQLKYPNIKTQLDNTFNSFEEKLSIQSDEKQVTIYKALLSRVDIYQEKDNLSSKLTIILAYIEEVALSKISQLEYDETLKVDNNNDLIENVIISTDDIEVELDYKANDIRNIKRDTNNIQIGTIEISADGGDVKISTLYLQKTGTIFDADVSNIELQVSGEILGNGTFQNGLVGIDVNKTILNGETLFVDILVSIDQSADISDRLGFKVPNIKALNVTNQEEINQIEGLHFTTQTITVVSNIQ